MRIISLGLLIFLPLAPATWAADSAALTAAVQKLADEYLATRAEPEHISGISISLSQPGGGREHQRYGGQGFA